jgi:NAD(P)-dependent dehydrogenase (short-subunit alcohol dehydrogenase family)
MNSKATPNYSELAGQVAVVTGAGRGIGRAIAAALSAAGMTTAVLARSASEIEETARTIEDAGGRAKPFAVDVTDAAAVGKAFEKIERSLGSVALLVNNAAIPGPIGPFWETDAEQWWRTLDVNLRGAMLCARAVLPGMISRRKGRIINIASSAIPVAYFSSYATSKAALVRFTETVAAEIKPHGISMFAVAPGTVRTAMAEHSLRSPDGQKWLPWFKRIFDQGLDVPVERPARVWSSNSRQRARTACRDDLFPSGMTWTLCCEMPSKSRSNISIRCACKRLTVVEWVQRFPPSTPMPSAPSVRSRRKFDHRPTEFLANGNRRGACHRSRRCVAPSFTRSAAPR